MAATQIPFFNLEELKKGEERIYGSATELIGWTPLVETKRISGKDGAVARIALKLESYQPGANVKDRIALSMIVDAERKGILVPGVSTLVEPTSGNTGIGLALVALMRGYKVAMVMPDACSVERRVILRAMGAEIYLISPDFAAVVAKCLELSATLPNAVMLDQLQNASNPAAHYQSTGPEIWKDTAGKVDIFVAGCGTGGTLTGTGRYLKEKNPKIQVVAVEPAESAIMSGGKKGLHGIQGIGWGIIQPVTDMNTIDQVVPISTAEAYSHTLRLIKEEGLLVGQSSGAAYAAALKLAKDPKNKGKLIVAVAPSASERYMSTDLFAAVRKECEEMSICPAIPSQAVWKEASCGFQKQLENGASFPLVLTPAEGPQRGADDLVLSILAQQQSVGEVLAKHGAVLFRGFSLHSAEDFKRVVKSFGWKVFQLKNSTDMEALTEDKCVVLANEAACLEERPSKVLFFCEEAPKAGSIIIIGGSKKLQKEQQQQQQQAFDVLKEEQQVELAWEQGDLLLIDNTSVVHARQPCTEAVSRRSILVSLAV